MTITNSGEQTRYRVAGSDQVAEGGRHVVDVGDLTIGVFRFRGRLYAYENACAHQGGPVCQGRLVHRVREVLDEAGRSSGFRFDEDEPHIVCPWHGAEYSVITGVHPGNHTVRLRSFEVTEDSGEIYVTV